MRVALFLPNLGGGGAERVALICANDLIAHGNEVDVVLARQGGELLPLLSPKVRVVELKAQRLIRSVLPLARYLREERPDALHAHMWPATVIAIMAHRLARSSARLIVSDHVAYSSPFLSARQMRWLRRTTKLLYPLADRRVAVSRRAAEDLGEISGLGRERFDVVFNPVVPPDRIASNPAVESLWGGAGKRIITVGSLKPVKNHALLIRAFARLGNDNARLMILGDGPERRRLEKLADELVVRDRVLMPGFVLNPWPYLASANLFALSSDYEGLPLVIAEAMYAGLNIVSTDCVSGPAEMLDGGKFGRLVPCNDEAALAAAISDALAEAPDPDRMRRRAEAISGEASLAEHRRLVNAG